VDGILERRGKNPRRIHGRVFEIKSIHNALESACNRIGIEDLRSHAYRQFAVLTLEKLVADTVTVMKIYGWKSVAMFMRYNEVDDSDP
jgi:hypothetical protein